MGAGGGGLGFLSADGARMVAVVGRSPGVPLRRVIWVAAMRAGYERHLPHDRQVGAFGQVRGQG